MLLKFACIISKHAGGVEALEGEPEQEHVALQNRPKEEAFLERNIAEANAQFKEKYFKKSQFTRTLIL